MVHHANSDVIITYLWNTDNDSNPISSSQGIDWREWLAIIPAMMYSFTIQHTYSYSPNQREEISPVAHDVFV